MTDFFTRWFGRKRDGNIRDVAGLAASLATPAVHLIKSSGPSRSHFGGAPHLPAGVAWPLRDGQPLVFLARLSLAELRAAHALDWLPEAGALLFFYDVDKQPWGYSPDDRGSWSVVLVPDAAASASSLAPETDPPPVTLPHRNIAFHRVDVLPSYERNPVARLEFSHTESDHYIELADEVFRGLPKHQVGGFPSPVQSDSMELEYQLASHGIYCGDSGALSDNRHESLLAGAANWRLLLQMDTDDDLGVMWGDAGTIYFWVEADAARESRFENAWLSLQCH